MRCANPAESLTQHQHYHRLSAAALNSGRNKNFVHRKGELSGGGPVFAGGADPIGSGFVNQPSAARRSQLLAKDLVALESPRSGDAGHNRAAGGRWTGDAVPMTKPETEASRCIFCKIALVMAPLAAGVVAIPGPS